MIDKIKKVVGTVAPNSKKFWFAFLAIGIVALVIDASRAEMVTRIAMAYLVGQGMADFGKERKRNV